ncbi:MAG: ABC transporter ATP-binding protein [Gammaproteobacteria bacterium]|nr:ABC transporter ATP-binding protein [Gammaproteobacteria bacterium]
MIEVKGLEKSFKTKPVLKGLSFTVNDHESVALLGANGAGKTTALRVICGLLNANGGSVSIAGEDSLNHPERAQAKFGAMGDREGLYERLSVREYLTYFGAMHGLFGKQCGEAIDSVVEQLGLQSLLNRRAAGFSQGERMKVSLARALLHKPKLLILDEPTRGLDVPSVRVLRRVLSDYRQQGGSILFSSHVMQEVENLADRILIMADGKIVAEGTSEELQRLAKVDHLEDAFVTLAGMEVVL